MVELEDKEISVKAAKGEIAIKRNEFGVPVIKADNFLDMEYGVGWVMAYDRGVQLELTRLAARGRLSEHLPPSPELIETDISMRRYNLWGYAVKQAEKLDEETREEALAFCRGINDVFKESPPAEFALLGYEPEPWGPADCIATVKIISLVDMDETQGWMKKFIIQMIQEGVPTEKLKELFVYMTDDPDPEYLEIIREAKLPDPFVPANINWDVIPKLVTSSNWMVSGKRTVSGKPILCGSPELDTSKLPALWQEVVLLCGDYYFIGGFVPGIPLPGLGRTRHLSWSVTYGCMDMMDYFIEEVKDGKYRRGENWVPFELREEVIKVSEGDPVTMRFYENEHGILEGEPTEDGYYLSFAWSMRDSGALALEHFTKASRSETVEEAMEHMAIVDSLAFNWGMADSGGNIGYQMSGRCPIRPEGWSGFIPLPGWDEAYDWKGCHDPAKNPRLYNPEEGYIVTANQDLNHLTDVHIQSLPMSDDRAARISELLAARDDHSVESMMEMQYNVYGKHAERIMPAIRPYLPDSDNGRLLGDWDLVHDSDSLGATLFERVYIELTKTVFGEGGLGREVMDYIVDNTELFNLYYACFDRVLLKEDSLWYEGKSRDELFEQAIARALEEEPVPYGSTRRVMMKNMVYGDINPDFNCGPIEIPGSRGTVTQGQIYHTPTGRLSTFSPTIRIITDFAEDKYYSCLAGGPCEKPASQWYSCGVQGWLEGRYNMMEPIF